MEIEVRSGLTDHYNGKALAPCKRIGSVHRKREQLVGRGKLLQFARAPVDTIKVRAQLDVGYPVSLRIYILQQCLPDSHHDKRLPVDVTRGMSPSQEHIDVHWYRGGFERPGILELLDERNRIVPGDLEV